jgi:hypothetical protein
VSYYQGKLKKRNWYLTAQEALDEKLVDEIIEAPFYAHSAVKHVPKPPKRPTTRKSNKEVVA